MILQLLVCALFGSSLAYRGGPPGGACLCVKVRLLNIRSRPGLKTTIIGKARKGECFKYRNNLKIIGYSRWYQIDYNGKSAWASGKYLNTGAASQCPDKNYGGYGQGYGGQYNGIGGVSDKDRYGGTGGQRPGYNAYGGRYGGSQYGGGKYNGGSRYGGGKYNGGSQYGGGKYNGGSRYGGGQYNGGSRYGGGRYGGANSGSDSSGGRSRHGKHRHSHGSHGSHGGHSGRYGGRKY